MSGGGGGGGCTTVAAFSLQPKQKNVTIAVRDRLRGMSPQRRPRRARSRLYDSRSRTCLVISAPRPTDAMSPSGLALSPSRRFSARITAKKLFHYTKARQVTLHPSRLSFSTRYSAIRELQHCFGEALTFNGNLRRRLVNVAQVGAGERHVHGAKILLETRELLRPGDRYDPQLLGEQPGQRDLRRRRVHLVRDALEQLDQRHVAGAGVRGEAGGAAPEVLRVELRRRVDLAREETCA